MLLALIHLIGSVQCNSALVTVVSSDDIHSLVPMVNFNLHGRHHLMVVDSSFSGLWVSKVGCVRCPQLQDTPAYEPSVDQLVQGSQMTLQGSVTCSLYNDRMQIGEMNPLDAQVCAATSVEGIPAGSSGFDGAFGIGRLWQKNKMLRVIFTTFHPKLVAIYWDHPRAYGGMRRIGELRFGSLMLDRIASVKWISAVGVGDEWSISAMRIRLRGFEVSMRKDTMLNTAMHESYFEKQAFDSLIVFLGASLDTSTQRYKVKYDYVESLPKIIVYLSRIAISLDPLSFVDYDLENAFGDSPDESTTFAYLSIKQADGAMNILGTNVLSNFHIIFDYDAVRIGFGEPIIQNKRKSGDELGDSTKKHRADGNNQ